MDIRSSQAFHHRKTALFTLRLRQGRFFSDGWRSLAADVVLRSKSVNSPSDHGDDFVLGWNNN